MFPKTIIFIAFICTGYSKFATAQEACSDVLPTLCPSMTYLCNNSFYQTYMGQNCRLSCQLCTPSPTTTLSPENCFDTLPTCQYSQFLCNNSIYLSYMVQYCPLTCGLCIPTATTSMPCEDKILIPNVPSSCPLLTSLCTVSIFQSIMQANCAKTCGFCDNDSPTTTLPIQIAPIT